MTNADRIRAMSDEELAGFCAQLQTDKIDEPCRSYLVEQETILSWMDWLKQEAAEPPKDRPAPICQTCGNFETCPWRHEGVFSGPKDKARRVVGCSDYKPE